MVSFPLISKQLLPPPSKFNASTHPNASNKEAVSSKVAPTAMPLNLP